MKYIHIQDQIRSYNTLFPKRNANLISRSFIRSIVETTFGQKFTDLHSSAKERQLQKSCVSFGEECTFRDMNYSSEGQTYGQTESDAYEPTMQYAQVGSKIM